MVWLVSDLCGHNLGRSRYLHILFTPRQKTMDLFAQFVNLWANQASAVSFKETKPNTACESLEFQLYRENGGILSWYFSFAFVLYPCHNYFKTVKRKESGTKKACIQNQLEKKNTQSFIRTENIFLVGAVCICVCSSWKKNLQWQNFFKSPWPRYFYVRTRVK